MAQGKVMVIPARRQVGNNIKAAERPKLRVAAYCRVSTDSDEQATSYETQIAHYTEYISKNPEWQLAGIFADDGISGTNTKKRTEFNRMIDECMAGNIDMIITKSISRFARNTLDCLKFIRQLKDKNIPVYFEKESINTMDADGNLVIDPEQAETVKRIYREYLLGYSMDKIAAGLEADGILTGAGKTKWWTSTINAILRNEKYIGDALLQKTYATDFLSKTRIENNGTVPKYYVEGNHEAIIPKEIFLQVQEDLVRRRVVHTSANGRKRSYSSNHCFSMLIYCGECNEMFRRIHWNNRGCKSIVWRCESRLQNTGVACRARTVSEEALQGVAIKAINTLLLDKDDYMKVLQNNITAVIRNDDSASTTDIDAKLLELQKELLKKAHNRDDYDAIAKEIFQLRELKAKSENDSVLRDEKLARITELYDFLRNQPDDITEFDETLARSMLKKITVFEDHVTVEFKSGISVDIEG